MTLLQYCAHGVATLILWGVAYVIFGVIWGEKTPSRLSRDVKEKYRALAAQVCNQGVDFMIYSDAPVEKLGPGALVTVKVWIPDHHLPKVNDGNN